MIMSVGGAPVPPSRDATLHFRAQAKQNKAEDRGRKRERHKRGGETWRNRKRKRGKNKNKGQQPTVATCVRMCA